MCVEAFVHCAPTIKKDDLRNGFGGRMHMASAGNDGGGKRGPMMSDDESMACHKTLGQNVRWNGFGMATVKRVGAGGTMTCRHMSNCTNE